MVIGEHEVQTLGPEHSKQE